MTEENKQLLEILRRSLWDDEKQGEEIPDHIRAELCAQTVEGLTAIAYLDTQNLKYEQTARFVKMAHLQRNAIQQLQSAGIPVVVIKGTAAGIYYPHPQLRTYGDIDLMVQPEHYHDAIQALRDGGWYQEGDIGSIHTPFHKNDERLELHQCPSGIENDKEGQFVHQYLLSGFSDIQDGIIEQGRCRFPVLPWQQNGLELIWHFRVHLNDGIGLRHVIDWMMFVKSCVNDHTFRQLKPVLEQAGLLTLAKAVTRMCQFYLGLPEENNTWCVDVDASLCAGLMDFIFEQGNFGKKRSDDRATRALTRYRSLSSLLVGMQRKGLREWPAAQKYPVIRPFAWLYAAIQGGKVFLTPSNIGKLRQARAESSKRNKVFDQLFGDKS